MCACWCKVSFIVLFFTENVRWSTGLNTRQPASLWLKPQRRSEGARTQQLTAKRDSWSTCKDWWRMGCEKENRSACAQCKVQERYMASWRIVFLFVKFVYDNFMAHCIICLFNERASFSVKRLYTTLICYSTQRMCIDFITPASNKMLQQLPLPFLLAQCMRTNACRYVSMTTADIFISLNLPS